LWIKGELWAIREAIRGGQDIACKGKGRKRALHYPSQTGKENQKPKRTWAGISWDILRQYSMCPNHSLADNCQHGSGTTQCGWCSWPLGRSRHSLKSFWRYVPSCPECHTHWHTLQISKRQLLSLEVEMEKVLRRWGKEKEGDGLILSQGFFSFLLLLLFKLWKDRNSWKSSSWSSFLAGQPRSRDSMFIPATLNVDSQVPIESPSIDALLSVHSFLLESPSCGLALFSKRIEKKMKKKEKVVGKRLNESQLNFIVTSFPREFSLPFSLFHFFHSSSSFPSSPHRILLTSSFNFWLNFTECIHHYLPPWW